MQSNHRLIVAAALAALTVAGLAGAANRVLVVDEADLAGHWVQAEGTPHVVPGFPTGGDHAKDVCVAIGFQISAQGETSGFSELSSWTSTTGDARPSSAEVEAYVQTAAAAVSMWRFTSKGRARAIYTTATFAFPGTSGQQVESIRAHCQIQNLENYISRQQAAEQRRGDILKSRMESRARDQNGNGIWRPADR